MKPGAAMPKALHLMAPGKRVVRLCGLTSGGYARVSERRWIKRFLALGGRFCDQCKASPTCPAWLK